MSYRIALLATPWEAVPPPKYGGTELIVANLADELTRRGHTVTVFATGDSRPAGRLAAVFPRALYRDGVPWNDTLRPLQHVAACFTRAREFDLIHNHANYFGLLFANLVPTPVVTTYHGDFVTAEKIPEKRHLLEAFRRAPFVAISWRQRALAKTRLNFVGTVHNGIAIEQFPFSPRPGNYLCWLGRITEKKGILEAITVARRLRLPLKIGAKIDPVDRAFFKHRVERRIDGKHIQYLGELDHRGKTRLLKRALALLNPITWEEPFGLVMAEAMACGTPVIAFPRGAAPEIVADGVTGYLPTTVDRMVAAVKRIHHIRRSACRARAARYFSREAMTDGYEKIYARVLRREKGR
ncbi:MAG: putative glycosyltransferase [Parcubacteria group bacterium Gr01-1014_31]|nr:MAG: putative glycosyltransferase [Parcubacteria group bacterium Gr01-1014_31]